MSIRADSCWFDHRRASSVVMVLAAVVWCCTARWATAESCQTALRPQDQVWIASTRGQGEPCQRMALRFLRCRPAAGRHAVTWQSANPGAFLEETSAARQTVFYVHGNLVSRSEARRRTQAVYRSLRRHLEDEFPLRLVGLSWPTNRIRGTMLKDVRVKAARARPASFQLARLVDKMDPETPIGMIGFSFGARVVTGALHLLGGGRLGGAALQQRVHAERLPVRVVLMASALDDDWLLPSRYHGRALSQVDRMLLLNNDCDRAMRWYRLTDRCRRPEALGFRGLAGFGRLGAARAKIQQRDVCCEVGRQHDFLHYVHHAGLMRQTWSCLAVPDAGRAS